MTDATGPARPAKPRKPLVMELRQWHRWLTLVLLVQLTIWLATALCMTLIPRSATTAYTFTPAGAAFDAAAAWPELAAMREIAEAGQVESLTLHQRGYAAQLDVVRIDGGQERWRPDGAARLARLDAATIAAHASRLAGEDIDADQVRLKTRHSPEYQKLPLPVWRVQADNAVLFFDPETGEVRTQTPFWRLFENWVTTIHVMDYTGGAQFRGNVVLTGFALIFLISAGLGVLAVRRVHLVKGGGLRSLRWHQGLGIVLAVQVVFWTTSGLGVVWLLHPLRDEAHAQFADIPPAAPAIGADIVHPSQLVETAGFTPARVRYVSVLGEPAYQLTEAGRSPRQALFNARTGAEIALTEADRDAIARERLDPAVFDSIRGWETAAGPAELDFYFYTGPWPVWKAKFADPLSGGVAIDQVTGYVHTPRTDREIFLERYYNLHVVNWRFGVVRYRLEPALLAVIALAMGLLVTGFILQARRWRKRRRQARRPASE
ncbi:MAG: PepSY-associated TM helix domain-containing protein [Oceanicaulis sp.]